MDAATALKFREGLGIILNAGSLCADMNGTLDRLLDMAATHGFAAELVEWAAQVKLAENRARLYADYLRRLENMLWASTRSDDHAG